MFKTYEVSVTVNGKHVGLVIRATSAADAMAVARSTYGPNATIRGARIIG